MEEQGLYPKILDLARADSRIRACFLCGSRADPGALRDRYSDYDILLAVEDIRPFLEEETWLCSFGEPLLVQRPEDWYDKPYDPESRQPYTWLLQYPDGQRLDLQMVDLSCPQRLLERDGPRRILVDKDGLGERYPGGSETDYLVRRPGEKEFQDTRNEFWWLGCSVVKNIRRGELTYVKYLSERVQMDQLLKLLGWRIGADHGFAITLGKYRRYLGRYLSEEEWSRLQSLYADGTMADLSEKLLRRGRWFLELEDQVGRRLGYPVDRKAGERILAFWERFLESS